MSSLFQSRRSSGAERGALVGSKGALGLAKDDDAGAGACAGCAAAGLGS